MEMKKYMTPDMEVVELKSETALLNVSGGTIDNPGSEPAEPGEY